MEKRARGPLLPEKPEFPTVVEYIWTWFMDLHETRGGGFGPGPVTWTELVNWSDLTGIRPTPWEARMIRLLDRAYQQYSAEKAKEETNT